jgi:hypothetical protein
MSGPLDFDNAATTEAPANVWLTIGSVVIAAAVLLLLSGVAFAFYFEGSTRQSLRAIATVGANFYTGGFLLAAAVALVFGARRAPDAARLRPVFFLVLALAIIVVIADLFSIWDYATMDVAQGGGFGADDGGWLNRATPIAFQLASATLALGAAELAFVSAPARVHAGPPPQIE